MNPVKNEDLLTVKEIMRLLYARGFEVKHRSTIIRWLRKYGIGKKCKIDKPRSKMIEEVWKVPRKDFRNMIKNMKKEYNWRKYV